MNLSFTSMKDYLASAIARFTPGKKPDWDDVPFKDQGMNFKEEGTAGTSIYAGRIYEDHLAEMNGKDWAEKVNEMKRADSNVAMVLKALKLPIKSANWFIGLNYERTKDLSPDQKEMAEKQKELLNKAFFEDNETTFTRLLGEILSFLDHGYSVFEVVFKYVQHSRFGQYISLKDVAFRSQKTIESWNVDKKGRLLSVSQLVDGDEAVNVNIDAKNIIHFAPDQEGDNYEGVSVLRPMYGNYKRKNAYLRWIAAGNEKSAFPTPMLKFLSEATQDEQAAAKKMLKSYTSGSSNFLIHSNKTELTTFKVDFDPEKMMKCVSYEDQSMVNSILASFLLLGQGGNGGSLALGKDLSDFFTQTFNTTTDYICEEINRVIVKKLIHANFGDVPIYAELVCENMKDDANTDFANILKIFIDAGLVKVDSELEKWVREKYQYPNSPQVNNEEITQGFSKENLELLTNVLSMYQERKIERQGAVLILKNAIGEIAETLVPQTPSLNTIQSSNQFSEQARRSPSDFKFSLEDNLEVVDTNAAFMAKCFESNLSAIATDYINRLTKLYKTDNVDAPNENNEIEDGRKFYQSLVEFLLMNTTDDTLRVLEDEGIKLSEDINFSAASFAKKKAQLNSLINKINNLSSGYEIDSDYMQTKSELNKLRNEFVKLVNDYKEDSGHWSYKEALADIESRAKTLVSVQLGDIKKKLDLQYQSSNNAASVASVVAEDLKTARDSYIESNALKVGADIASSQSVNDTRLKISLDIPEVIGYVYDAVIDDKTCPACIALNQYYFPKDSAYLSTYTPPLHPNSRATWKIIYKGDNIDNYKHGVPNLGARELRAINLSECQCRRVK